MFNLLNQVFLNLDWVLIGNIANFVIFNLCVMIFANRFGKFLGRIMYEKLLKPKQLKEYNQIVEQYVALKYAKVNETLEITAKLQAELDEYKPRYNTFTRDQQTRFDECQNDINRLRGEAMQVVIGQTNVQICMNIEN
jgi:FtsZ-binding cell division protein ZapB